MPLNQMSCCGCFELHYGNFRSIQNPEKVLKQELMESFLHVNDYNSWDLSDDAGRRPPYIIMTDVTRRNSIKKLVHLIKEEGLGKVHTMPSLVNDNTSNRITVWVWTPNWDILEKWTRQPVKRKRKS